MDAWKRALKERLERRKATFEAIAATTPEQRDNQPRRHEGLSFAEALLHKTRQHIERKGWGIESSVEGGIPQTAAAFMADLTTQNQAAQHTMPQPRKELISKEEEDNQSLDGSWTLQKQNKERPWQNMEWETMELLPPGLVEGRPGTMRVYLPPRERNASYGVLDYSAVVMAGSHCNDPYLAQRISTALDGHYDMHPRDFRVTAPDKSIGDLLVEFPDIDLCRRAVQEGYFILANGTEVQLKQWTPALGMIYHSMTHRARVKLYDVPIHNRNEREINHLIFGIGYVDIMASVITNGRYEALRVLIACHDPRNIPSDLLMTTDPYSKLIRVVLEGFINIDNELRNQIPPEHNPPPPALWRTSETNEGRHESRSEYRRERNYRNERRGDFKATAIAGVTAMARIGTNKEKTLTELPKVASNQNNLEVLEVTPLCTGYNFTEEFNVKLTRINGSSTPQIFNLIFTASVHTIDIPNWVLFGQKEERNFEQIGPKQFASSTTIMGPAGNGPILLGYEALEKLDTARTAAIKSGIQTGPGPQIAESREPLLDFSAIFLKPSSEISGSDWGTSALTAQELGLANPIATILETAQGENEKHAAEISDVISKERQGDAAHKHNNEIDQADRTTTNGAGSPLLEGPPPGFENTPHGNKRRSRRILEKQGPLYLSAIDRARVAQGYVQLSETPIKKREKKATVSTNLSYLESLEPLSDIQATLVVSMAGVTVDQQLQGRINQAVILQEPQTPIHA
ncbi:hypothetical protein FCM35_KLT00176 [Carex littledalei]|uniref:Uncharacterized protein n=1 Tax=Carex littledalei TaxID=544730 RepID=A0A833RKE5_9POAL|nr:hypothetical protein FCM35_KLT00176 [Carex littledalei]